MQRHDRSLKVRNNVIFGSMLRLGLTPRATAGPLRIPSITDGTSNSALLSEHLLAASDYLAPRHANVTAGTAQGKRGLFQIPFQVVLDQGSTSNALAFVNACKAVPGTSPAAFDGFFGSQWLLSADYAIGNNAYTHVMTPNSISCTGNQDFSGLISYVYWGGIGAAITATSNHPGGVNVAFGDGSVKFLKHAIDLQTWWALGTRNGREVISGDAY